MTFSRDIVLIIGFLEKNGFGQIVDDECSLGL